MKVGVAAIFLELLNTARSRLVLARNLSTRLITDWWKLNGSISLIARSRSTVGGLTIGRDSGSSSTLLVSLSLVLLLLLPGFPLLSDLLEFCDTYVVSLC